VENLPNPLEKIECFCIKYANKIGGRVESQTMKKLNLSAPVDETVDLFIALIKLIMISLTHHITNKVMVRYRQIPISKTCDFMPIIFIALFCKELPNGSRYPLGVGGWIPPRNGENPKPGNCQKTRRIPQVNCTLC
jgi:hypothetical protein